MTSKVPIIRAVPTNIITGFLGVGKTSTILHLLKSKPRHERWAVLVNEFGEIGVDGSLIEGQHAVKDSIFIREVPGGCMCCAAGLPMQVALNQLLVKAKPDRLLIEPTGLGHPKEVLQVLSGDDYRDVLLLHKILTLVDARKLSDSRYIQHDTFNQQIAIADTVIGNKVDLYQNADKTHLMTYVQQKGQAHTDIMFTQHGEIPFSALQGFTSSDPISSHHHRHKGHSKPLASEMPLPECGFLAASNDGEGFSSIGWRFSPNTIFHREQLLLLLASLRVERMKATFITDCGVFAYNLVDNTLTEVRLVECQESRIEIIYDRLDDSSQIQPQLLACAVT